MTHVDIESPYKEELRITEKLIRISIGIENHEDIISDIKQALESVG